MGTVGKITQGVTSSDVERVIQHTLEDQAMNSSLVYIDAIMPGCI